MRNPEASPPLPLSSLGDRLQYSCSSIAETTELRSTSTAIVLRPPTSAFRISVAITLLLLLFFQNTALAQSLTDSVLHITQVEIVSSRDLKKEDAGMKQTRIDTTIIRSLAHQDIDDILAGNTSIYIKNHGRGALATASFRGTSASHTQVEWNGMNINSPMLGMVDFSIIPAFIIDELSLEYGSASIASSSGGLGGMISLKNIPDWEKNFQLKYQQGLGSFHTNDEYLMIAAGNKKFQSKTRIYRNYSKNDYPFINKKIIEKDEFGELYHPLQKNDNAAFQKKGLSQEFYLRASEKTIFSSHTWMQDAKRSIPRVNSSELYTVNSQLINKQQDKTLKSILSMDHYGDKYTLNVNTGIDIQHLSYYIQALVSGTEALKPVNSGSKMQGYTNNVQFKYNYSKALSFQGKVQYNRYNVSSRDTVLLSGYKEIRNEASFFGGTYFAPHKNLHLALQLRKDLIGKYHTPLIYTFGLNYTPSRIQNLQIKWNLARNYHHPTLNDLYWQPGGNPELKPEEGYSTELNLDYAFSNGNLSIHPQLSAYYSDITNWIIWLPGFKGYWEPLNIMQVRSSGVEFHIVSNWTAGNTDVFLNGNFSFTSTMNVQNRGSGEGQVYSGQLPFIPRLSGNVFLTVNHRGFYMNYQHQYIGQRELLNSENIATGFDQELTKGSMRLYALYMNNISVGKRIHGKKYKLSLEVNIDNIFNENYRNILQQFMPGRSYYLVLKMDI